jgi:hypothetical protein
MTKQSTLLLAGAASAAAALPMRRMAREGVVLWSGRWS